MIGQLCARETEKNPLLPLMIWVEPAPHTQLPKTSFPQSDQQREVIVNFHTE